MLALRKGMMTITLLLLLSSALLIAMLLNNDILSFYSSQASQRLQYVKTSLEAQQKSLKEQNQACQNLPLSSDDHLLKVPFQSEKLDFAHYIWCKHIRLFKQMPTQASNVGNLTKFIDEKMFPLFSVQGDFNHSEQNYDFYWFAQPNQIWQLPKEINGIVIATGNLSIRGQGSINGAIITGGRLELEKGVTINYQEKPVKYWYHKFSRWQKEENSWYDFNAL